MPRGVYLHKPSLARKRAASIHVRKLWKQPWYRRFQRNRFLGKRLPKYHADAIRKSQKKKSYIETQRRNSKKNWKNEDFRNRMGEIRSTLTRVSKIQRKFFYQFRRFGFVLEYPIDKFSIDIANPTIKIAIEVDGHYWHSRIGKKQVTRRKKRLLKKLGWRMIRVNTRRIRTRIKMKRTAKRLQVKLGLI